MLNHHKVNYDISYIINESYRWLMLAHLTPAALISVTFPVRPMVVIFNSVPPASGPRSGLTDTIYAVAKGKVV